LLQYVLLCRGCGCAFLFRPQDGSRGNAVDPYLWSEFPCQRFGKHHIAGFRCAINRMLTKWPVRVNIGNIDDAASVAAQCICKSLCEKKRGFQVAVHQVIPLIFSSLIQWRWEKAGSVVDEHIKALPGRQSAMSQLLDFVQVI